MDRQGRSTFEFGRFRLSAEECLLTRDGEAVPLEPQVFKTLQVLVTSRGHLCEKRWLLEQVWGDTFVEEGNLTRNISVLRKALDDGAEGNHYIETIPKRGYRFVAEVKQLIDEETLLIEEHTKADVVIEEEINGNTGIGTSSEASELPTVSRPGIRRFSSAVRIIAEIASLRSTAILICFGLVAFSIVALGLVRRWNSSMARPESRAPFQATRLTKLTSGKALRTAISPDGKQVAYVKENADGQSLWLRQTAFDSEVQLVPPNKIDYDQVVYARDGDFIYYAVNKVSLTGSRGQSLRRGSTLYEVPLLGGVPRKIVEDVNSRFSLSHDGRRFAFFRDNEEQREQYLTVVQTDGSGERRAATNKMPDYCWAFLGPVWSPDDTRVACHAAHVGQNVGKFVAIRISDAGREDLTPLEWKLSFSGEWTSDGLIVSAQRRDEDQWQLWLINPRDGTARRLTNDLNKYASVSVTTDGHSIAAIQSLALMNIWLVSLSDPLEARQLTSGASTYYDISVTPDNKLVYSTVTSGLADIWEMDLAGKNHRQLTRSGGSNYSPVVSSDGRYLIFHSNRSGTYHLYRSGADGSNPQRLTNEAEEEGPADISPDSRTVIFALGPLEQVPIEGGTPVLLNGKYNHTPVISPDGKFVATWYSDDFTDGLRIALFSVKASSQPSRVFAVPLREEFGDRIRWTRDGKALLYVHTLDGVSNIWRQPIDGGAPAPLSHFTTERIFSFSLTPDGRYLACVRGITAQDVVLLSDK